MDTGLRRSWRGWRIICDPCEVLKALGADDQRLVRIVWDEDGRFCCQGQDGMLPLADLMGVSRPLLSDNHEGTRDDGHDHGGKHFLTNPIGSPAREGVDGEGHLFIFVSVPQRPPAERQVNNALTGGQSTIQQIGEQDGHGTLRRLKADDSECDRLEFLAWAWAKPGEGLLGWGDPEGGFGLSTFDKDFNGGKGACRGPAEEKKLTGIDQDPKAIIAGIAAIKEEHTLFRSMRGQGQGFLTFRAVATHNGPGDRQTSEHIRARGEETLGIMVLSGLVKPAVWIELLAHRLSGRQRKF